MSDCCSSNQGSHDHKNSKGAKSLDWKNVVLWSAIGVLAIVVLFTVFSGGGSTSSAIPAAQSASQAASSYGGMVGGC